MEVKVEEGSDVCGVLDEAEEVDDVKIGEDNVCVPDGAAVHELDISIKDILMNKQNVIALKFFIGFPFIFII